MASEFIVSGFGDEIAPEPDAQLAVLLSEGIRHLELRAVWETNVLDLSDEQVAQVHQRLAAHGVRLSAIGSPIGKVPITDSFDEHRQRFQRAIWVAQQLDCPRIRIFSFFLPADEAPRWRDEVLRRLAVLTADARAANMTLLHENERDIYGDTPERCRDLLDSIGSPHLRATFDPANFVLVGVRPFDQAYPLLRDHIAYLHIKDAVFSDGTVRVAGEGDGQIEALLRAEAARGFHGFASLEPHLQLGGRYAGFSGPDRFRQAAQALRRLLTGIAGATIS